MGALHPKFKSRAHHILSASRKLMHPMNCTNWIMTSTQHSLVQGLDSPQELESLSLVLAGAVGGVSFLGLMYPFDIIKSKLQVQEKGSKQYSGSFDCLRQILHTDGIRGLYRGVWPCLIRALPANAASFVAYEQTMRLMTRLPHEK
jgi:solute carrier family 25 (mitochondrial carnitine/acylcarnitine transporter), member 20/29